MTETTSTRVQTRVEQIALKRSKRRSIYTPTEKIKIIEVENFPALGKLTALRFLEWVQNHPDGVISLPTGKTPEHFIKWVTHYLNQWGRDDVARDLEENGVSPDKKPDMKNLRFVQIDEFYPIDPLQHNSFNFYVKKYYIEGFGLDPQKALLINCWNIGVPKGLTLDEIFPEDTVDLSLRTRFAKSSQERLQKQVIEAVDQYCVDYERKIRDMGGIEFFLGGIGPDGHIAFNIRGSDHFSTTRLTKTNYETQAGAASDLGGIEVARNRLVITIGLSTITYNKKAVALIIAAGEAKAGIVAKAIQTEKNNLFPASVLQELTQARFYLTRGAASRLVERRYEDFRSVRKFGIKHRENSVIDLCMAKRKKIRNLTTAELMEDRFTKLLLQKSGDNHSQLLAGVEKSLVNKIERGLEAIENKTFLHTAPHHDDIMLGYLPYIAHLVRTPKNLHTFTYMTSGFTAVTNQYVLGQLENLMNFIDCQEFTAMMAEGYFDPKNESGQNRDVHLYLDGVAAHSKTIRDEASARRLLRNLVFLFEEGSVSRLKDRINELIDYFSTQYSGKKDLAYIQQLKGMIREWEADLLWAHFGFNTRSVVHLRLGFYTGRIFTERPEIDRDVKPILELLQQIDPDVVTVAFDPEGSGPDTHYKVLQAISEALKLYVDMKPRKDIEIWGYRNVWYRFHPSDADVFVPVSLNSMALLDRAFHYSFGSQRAASFPSHEYDGPFSRLAQKIQVEQFLSIKTCLGRDFFNENPHPRLRACHGLCFLRKMNLEEFHRQSAELRQKMEADVELD